MATASEEALRAIFEQIRDERKTHANTATRIGDAFLSLLSHLDNGTFLKQGDTESTEYILSVTGGASASLTKLFTLETVTEQGEERVTLATPLAPFKELELRDYLQIGDARLRWDSERQALYVIGKDGSTPVGFYSTGWLSAKGANPNQGEGGGGGGVSYSRLDTWEGYTDEEKGGWVLSAYLGVRLHQDIENLKNGVAMSYAVTGTGNAITDVTRDGSRWVFTKGKTFSELWHTHTLSDISDLNSSWDSLLKEAPSAYITRWPSWTEVKDKPSTFTPSSHKHVKADITDFPTTWAWSAISGKPSTFTPSAHTHAIGDVTGLQSALDAKLPAATFEELFEKVTLSTGETAIRAKLGLYSDKWLSAKGANPNQGEGGGGGVSYSRLDSWEGYTDEEKGGWVLSAYLGVRLHQDIENLKNGVAMSYAVTGTGNAITDVTRDGSRWVFTRGKTFSELGHTHTLSDISNLHSSWDAVLKAQKPNWLTAVSLATISDLHANWDAILKVAPSAYVTRWPTAAEVGALTQSAADSRYAMKTVTISAGAGLTGGGNLSANRTLSLAAVGTAGTYTKVTVDAYGRVTAHASLSAADIPSLSISKISGLQAALDKKLEATAFTELFEKVTLADGTTAIRAKYGLYSDKWLSAKGANPNQGEGGGGGVSYSRLDSWEGYTDEEKGGWVLSAYLGVRLHQDIENLKSGVAMSYAVTGTGNAITDVTRDGSRWVFTKGKTFSELGHTHPLSDISNLHSSWDAVLKAQKPNWLTAVSLATISDLHANWDAILKVAPSAYVTRWPTAAEVGALTQTTADGRYALKTVTISAGAGLTGGGNLSANRTLSLAAVGTAGTYTKVTVDAYGRVTAHASLSAADIPTLSISKISGLQAALDKKLEATAFTELFEKVTLSTGETAIRAKLGLYSDKWLSAKGANPNQGEGGGFAYTRLDTWEGYTDEEKGGWVLSAYLGVRLHQDIENLKNGVAMSYAVTGTGNAITDVTRDGSRWVFTRGKTFSELGHTHPLSNIYDLHSSWDSLLKEAPSAYITRWPSWTEVKDKPSTFTPTSHTHTKAQITDFPTTWAWSAISGKPTTFTPSAHQHPLSDLSDLHSSWDAILKAAPFAGVSRWPSWGEVTDKPTSFTPSSHTHAISQVSGLQAALDAKLPAATFDELFEKVTLSTGETAIRAKLGLYSDKWVSAKGANPSAGEGGGTAYNRLDTWEGYTDELATWVLSAGLGHSLYNDVKSLKQGAAVSLTTQGSGNAVTDIAKSGTKLTVTKGLSFLTAHQNIFPLTIQGNGTAIDKYTPNSAAKTINITPASIGAAASGHTHSQYLTSVSLATISDLHSSWDAVLKVQKPNWLTAVSLATISDLHSSWDALLKAQKPTTLAGYGIADGVNAVSVTGSGNAVSAASVSGHTLTLTKGLSALTSHQAIYALTLLGTGSTIATYNPKSAAATINLSAETLRMARGNVSPQTGRTQNYGWLYSYNCAGETTGDRPATYMSVVGFGRGTGGTVEIGGGWVSSMGLWYRALRNYEDNWYAWRKLLDSVTYTEYTVTKTGGGASGTWGIGISGNAATASKWQTKRTISLTGAVTGSVSLDGSGNVSLATTYAAANISALDSRYVNVSGDTMTGLLSLSSGSTHKGAKVGNVYVNAIDRALIIQNAKEIRFGQSDNWAYNDWGGLTYDHSKKYLYLGIADGTIFRQNAGERAGGSLLTPGIGNIFVGNNTSNKVWHAGNDGSGSGLDADLLDGTHKSGLFTAFSANGNSTRITIGGVTKDLTVPYASNADKLDGLQATSFMRCDGANGIALTGGNGNTEGYRLVIQKTMTGWLINNLVFVVASRHNGQGILSVAFHITADSPSSYGYSIRYFGANLALRTPFRAFYNTSTHVFRLYWHYSDYTSTAINVLRVEGFPSPSNGTWYEAMPSDNGTELTIEYNNADTIGGTSKGGLLTALSSSSGTNLSLTVGGTTKTVADLYATAAEKLLTARTINGTSFNGTANIVTSYWGTARNIAIASSNGGGAGAATSVNGSANVTLKLPATITAALSGNASTASKLQTARTLWGRSFDGSANVSGDLSGVGNISASGVFSTSKATNTYLAGNQGQALVNSTAAAGAYVMLHRGCSTNGYFTLGTYQGTYLLQYTAKSTVTAGNNSVTKSLTLLNEAGNSTFPGTLHASGGIYSDQYVSAKGQNTSSDMRLKDVLGSVTLPLERIANAPSFEFRWRDGSGESAGSSAQYWREVLPSAVRERGGYLEMQYGNIALISAISIARETMRVDREVTRLREECRRLRGRVKALEGAAGTRHLTAT